MPENLKEKIEKEFREKFPDVKYIPLQGFYLLVNKKDIESFLFQTIQQVLTDLEGEFLEKGHGGGNWRRVIVQVIKSKKEQYGK